jgi:hypothetical protein
MSRVQHVPPPTAVEQHRVADDQSGFAKDPELPADRESTEVEQVGEPGRLAWPNGERRDDPASRRIREEGDPGSVPTRHGANHGTGRSTPTYLRMTSFSR